MERIRYSAHLKAEHSYGNLGGNEIKYIFKQEVSCMTNLVLEVLKYTDSI